MMSFYLRYSIGQIMRLFKSITAKRLFAEHPALKKDWWGREFWTDGYYAAAEILTIKSKNVLELNN